MIRKLLLLFHIISCSLVFSQNSLPEIKNVSYVNDAINNVLTINYDLIDQDDDSLEIIFRASHDNGNHFFANSDSVTGDIGFPVSPGANKSISWFYKSGMSNIESKLLEIIADDKYKIDVQDIVNQVDSNRLEAMLRTFSKPRSLKYDMAFLYHVRDSIEALFIEY